MKQHGIRWLNGHVVNGVELKPETWNPIVGCSKVSAGCLNCYAERGAKRLAAMGTWGYADVLAGAGGSDGWSGETRLLFDGVLQKPLHWKKPRVIFVNSMGDLFHENTPFEWIDQVMAVVALCPQHRFIFLTKRADRMELYFYERKNMERIHSIIYQYLEFEMDKLSWLERFPLKNIWLGVTAENQDAADERIPHLLRTPAACRFVSVEPMLGKVGLAHHFPHVHGLRNDCFWVICGGESGPGARMMDCNWPGDLRDQCQAASSFSGLILSPLIFCCFVFGVGFVCCSVCFGVGFVCCFVGFGTGGVGFCKYFVC